MTASKCAHCGVSCSMDAADAAKGWHCNCVVPCPHANQGGGWYYAKRRERVVEVVEVIYYVWADNPDDAIKKLDNPTERKERAIMDHFSRTVEPESPWGDVAYDFNEGMGR